jgi:hypothetical protein
LPLFTPFQGGPRGAVPWCGLGAWGSLTGHAARSAKVPATLDTRPQVPCRCFEGDPSGITDATCGKHVKTGANRSIPSRSLAHTGPCAHPRPRTSKDMGPGTQVWGPAAKWSVQAVQEKAATAQIQASGSLLRAAQALPGVHVIAGGVSITSTVQSAAHVRASEVERTPTIGHISRPHWPILGAWARQGTLVGSCSWPKGPPEPRSRPVRSCGRPYSRPRMYERAKWSGPPKSATFPGHIGAFWGRR